MSNPSEGLFSGPGSQPADEDGAQLSYMQMPSEMLTFSQPDLPEPEEVAGLTAGKAVMQRVHDLLAAYSADGPMNIVDLAGLDKENLGFVDQMLGEGEVSVIRGGDMQVQESVLAGVWRIRETDASGRLIRDVIEIGSFPTVVIRDAFAGATTRVAMPEMPGEGVFNAPALLPEINDHIEGAGVGGAMHTINLSLLPHTEQDLVLLDNALGRGTLNILSRGYGNCRVVSTAVKNVWWVRFYNSQDALILNTIEVTPIPEVVRAAPEDIADSAMRLKEILEVYQ